MNIMNNINTIDITKWTDGQDVTDILINTIEKTTNNGKSCFTKGTAGSSPIRITNNSPITLDNTGSGAPGRFIYIYRTAYTKLSKAKQNDAQDITPSFFFGLQKKVRIKSRTNGYVQEYWVLWSSGVNSMSIPTNFALS